MFKSRNLKCQKNEVRTKVVSSAAIASVGVANGRNIPVVIVEADEDGQIASLLSIHKTVPVGICSSQWGVTKGKEYTVLYLTFTIPVEQKIVLFFDVIKYGVIVNQILHSKCMYLMVGDKGTRFSEHLEDPRLLLEIPCDDFQCEWENIYRGQFLSHLKKDYKISRRDATEIFNQIHKKLDDIKTLRMK